MEEHTEIIENSGGKPLTSNAIKYIATVAMLIDHIAWCFVDTSSMLGQIMHIIGRITAPIMCYFIAEGYHYTKNVKMYLLRLGIFALISWFPFVYMEYGTLAVNITDGQISLNPVQGVIYTLFLGLIALISVHNETVPKPIRGFIVLIICGLSIIGDWPFFAIVWILLFDKFHGDFKKQAIAFAASSVILIVLIFGKNLTDSLFQFGVLLALIPLYFYNGKRGKGGSFCKWFFYIFYPLHLAILGILKYNIF